MTCSGINDVVENATETELEICGFKPYTVVSCDILASNDLGGSEIVQFNAVRMLCGGE